MEANSPPDDKNSVIGGTNQCSERLSPLDVWTNNSSKGLGVLRKNSALRFKGQNVFGARGMFFVRSNVLHTRTSTIKY